ncbi:hypothetical protein RhiirA1_452317 [Rhizophagus irregularis]|uniref:Uncharacterized protein n=1 Tax=Rhizophagus irregularis TaxID=588596 RepID=A0A2N0SA71_9GLOM|nr:hypothetical protein RhiirA1_452317 [Rhizophagus irregularis]
MDDLENGLVLLKKMVEDALYDFCIKYPNDKIYVNEEVFTESELDEIREYKPKPMPETY